MAKSIAALEGLLAALPADLSHGLFAKAHTIPLSADQILFSAGDKGDGCYHIDQGLLKASVTEPGGGERILAVLGPRFRRRGAVHDRRGATFGFGYSAARFKVELH